jgi:two-component system sensor histidine kinase/response regulator
MGQRLLVVEDDAVISQMLTMALSRRGYDVSAALNGLDACRIVADQRPDLILLDVNLPDLDGWEICSMIRTLSDPELSSTPIVMVTSRASEQEKLKGLRMGADDYVTKPFSLPELFLRVDNLVAKRDRRRPATVLGAGTNATSAVAEVQSRLCHEAKNHLGAIAGFARRIESVTTTISPDTLARYVGFIRQSAEHLSSLVENVLLFQKIEAGEWEARHEAVNLSGVVEDVISLLSPFADEKRVELRTEVEEVPLVRFDRSAATVCLANVVENAVKFAPERSAVRVRLCRRASRVWLEVEDTGPGIPEDEAERVFEKFYRGRSQAQTTPGAGLGLYLVKTLGEALGATVALVTRQGEGALFRIEFCPADAENG